MLALLAAGPLLQQEAEPLVVEILSDGAMRIDGKTLYRPKPRSPNEEDISALEDLFAARRQDEKYQAVKGRDEFVNYAVEVRADRDTPFHYLQLLYRIAATHGGVTEVKLARPKGASDGRDVLTVLPRDRGLAPGRPRGPELQDVRVFLCVFEHGDFHESPRGRHEHAAEAAELADLERTSRAHLTEGDPSHLVLDDVCAVRVENVEIGRLYKTRVCRIPEHREDRALSEEQRSAANRRTYRAIAEKAKALYEITPSSIDPAVRPPVLLDADSAIPYEHIVGVMNACRELGIDHFELPPEARREIRGARAEKEK